MAELAWNLPGERRFETGVSRGVLYPKVGPAVPWNGLVSVASTLEGSDLEAFYFDGVKYADFMGAEEFKASVEAYTAPPEFDICQGIREMSPGLSISQQPRATFGFSYQTLMGNELVGSDVGYKIHLVWGCTAASAGRAYSTVAASVTASTRSWSFDTVPQFLNNARASSHLVIDSTRFDQAKLEFLESVLYGSAEIEPQLPSLSDILEYFS